MSANQRHPIKATQRAKPDIGAACVGFRSFRSHAAVRAFMEFMKNADIRAFTPLNPTYNGRDFGTVGWVERVKSLNFISKNNVGKSTASHKSNPTSETQRASAPVGFRSFRSHAAVRAFMEFMKNADIRAFTPLNPTYNLYFHSRKPYIFPNINNRRPVMMITIQVPDSLPLERIRQRIREIESSLSEEAKFWETLNTGEQSFTESRDDTAFLSTFGSWQDDRDAETIVREIMESRQASERKASL